MLNEVPSVLGLELCMLSRRLRLAADCPPARRTRLFASKPARHVAERRVAALNEAPTSLHGPLRVLMRLNARQECSEEDLSRACEEVALWAQNAGHPCTAVHFAEVGAALRRKDAYSTFIAGRVNRICGEDWRAEVFYGAAIRYAYREQNWDVYVRANLGLGRLMADRGCSDEACNSFGRAARVALDQGHAWLAAQTYHDLLVLHYEQGDFTKAAEYGTKALRTYPLHHERYPIAVHDFMFLHVCLNHHTEVLPSLKLLVQAPLGGHDQVLVWGTLARAAGSLRLTDEFADAESRILELAPHYDLHAPFAFINLAFGAWALGDVELARTYAEKGTALARVKERPHDEKAGRNLLDVLSEGRPAPTPAPPLTGESAQILREMTSSLAKRLPSWRARPWTKQKILQY